MRSFNSLIIFTMKNDTLDPAIVLAEKIGGAKLVTSTTNTVVTM